jgi:hypothetical protein
MRHHKDTDTTVEQLTRNFYFSILTLSDKGHGLMIIDMSVVTEGIDEIAIEMSRIGKKCFELIQSGQE